MGNLAKTFLLLGILGTLFIVHTLYKFMHLPPAYEMLDNRGEETKIWKPNIDQGFDNVKG